MAKVMPSSPGQSGSLTRLIGVVLLGAMLFGLSVVAQAQSPGSKTDPKKPADSKAADPKAADPKAAPSPSLASTDEGVKVINDLISAKWKNDKGEVVFTPAAKCDDFEFIRRVSLDIIGRIAKVDEIEKFLADVRKVGSSKARGMLVDRLLASPEYVSNWSRTWTHWLMTRTGDPLYKDQINLWLEEEMFSQENMSVKDLAEKLITAQGKTNANGAVNYLLANLGGTTAGTNPNAMPGPQVLEKEGQFDMVPATSRTARLFLGYQIQCTQCHDHPFNGDWKQHHFWGFNAFFRQIQREGTPPQPGQNMMGRDLQMTLKDNTGFNKKGVVFFEKRNGVFLPSEPMFLDGSKLPKNGQLTRREELSRFLTGHKNFSKAYINRMWAHFFSRGMNEKPIADDFGDHNPVVQEELLDRLGEMFSGSASYNPKTLIRWICASDAYQLKTIANKSNDKAEDEVFFSRQMLKPMNPEQLLESLLIATRTNLNKDDPEQQRFRREWMQRLVVNFGDDEGNELSFNGTVVQVLLMMNGRDINTAINSQNGTVANANKLKSVKDKIDYLFLMTLNRKSTEKEYQQLYNNRLLKYGVKENDYTGFLQDTLWALLNCNEFILNH